ncbi:Protein of unknown function DUF594 - like 7 [Theobroma cacao]|nr:Protein of unknown function DUF594 - like 7 [Theobroma cacao]
MPIHYNHHKVSSSLRALCFLSDVSSLIAFSAIMDKSVHLKVDIVITYLLLLGAISLDIYSSIMHPLSTWAMIRFSIPKSKVHKTYYKAVASRMHLVEAEMAIKSMAQHDLINYFVKAKTKKFIRALRIIDTGNLLQKYGHTNWKPVDCELKEFSFSHLKEKRKKLAEKDFRPEDLEKLLNAQGESILVAPVFEDLEEDTTDFSVRIIRWHLATELVYYDDLNKFRIGKLGSFCQFAKSLSDYMMYLVLVRPMMLPKGLCELINRASHDQLLNFCPDLDLKKGNMDFSTRRKKFTAALIGHEPSGVDSYGVELIGSGSHLARKLQSLVTDCQWDHEEKWEMISKVWLEMMLYAATHCSWKEHAQQLRHGGELLTHVALLMAHLGLTTQIRRDKPPDHEDELNLPFPL